MSKVTIQEITPGSDTDVADVNSTINSWNTNTASGVIDEENFRTEALDTSSFDRDFVVYGDTNENDTSPPAGFGEIMNVTNTSLAEVTNGGSPALHVGGFTTTADDSIVVRCSVEVRFEHGAAEDNVTLSLGIKSGSGGVPTFIPETVRKFSDADAISSASTFTPSGFGFNGNRVYTVTWLEPGSNPTAGISTNAWFTVLVAASAVPSGTIKLFNGHIMATHHRKSSS